VREEHGLIAIEAHELGGQARGVEGREQGEGGSEVGREVRRCAVVAQPGDHPALPVEALDLRGQLPVVAVEHRAHPLEGHAQ
jgi:hypothetical protein